MAEVHFGFEKVSEKEKQTRVNQVFSSVYQKYDVMNDVMSFGMHHIWKRFAIEQAYLRPDESILDIAAGTGDMTYSIYRKVSGQCQLISTDINQDMLAQARERMVNSNYIENVEYVLANAEQLPFQENSFDCAFISFGLRNVTHIDHALRSTLRVLRPGGRFLILEFSKPHLAYLNQLYDAYSFNIIPRLGQWLAGDAESYQYLAESIRMHPEQEKLKDMMAEAGFENINYFNLTGGIVALHKGYKL